MKRYDVEEGSRVPQGPGHPGMVGSYDGLLNDNGDNYPRGVDPFITRPADVGDSCGRKRLHDQLNSLG